MKRSRSRPETVLGFSYILLLILIHYDLSQSHTGQAVLLVFSHHRFDFGQFPDLIG